MYPVSQRYKDAIKQLSRTFNISVVVTPKLGEPFTLTDQNLKQGSVFFEEAVMSGDALELGSTVAGSFECEVVLTPTLKLIDFADAKIEPTITLILPATETYPTASSESVPIGVFHVDSVEKGRKTTKLKALDNLSKLDIDYSKSTLTYPATLAQIYANICSHCGVPVKPGLWFYNYTVPRRPKAGVTFRNVLGSLAEIQGSYARCNRLGQICIEWLERYTIATTIDPNTRSKLTKDDYFVPITGVTMETMSARYTGLGSKEGNIVDLSDNLLIMSNHQTILNQFIYYTVYGNYVVPHNTIWSGDPAIQAGDRISVITIDDETFTTNITKLKYKYHGSSEVSCSSQLTGTTNIIPSGSKNRGNTGDATAALAAAMGYYVTADGSGYYIHDQPNLADSTQVFDGNTVPTPPPIYGPPWQLAVDGDFSGTYNGEFKYIGSKTNIILPDVIKGKRVTTIQGMFGNNSIENLLAGVISTNTAITNASNAFNGYYDLDDSGPILDLSIFDTRNVVDFSYMFYGCGKFSILFGDLFQTSKGYDMSHMFDRCRAKGVDLSGFDTSGAMTLAYMFNGSDFLSLDLTAFTNEGVKNMAHMFHGCGATTINLTNFFTGECTTMAGMFYGGVQKNILDLTSFDTSKVIDMSSMFASQKTLNLYMSSFNTNKVTSMNAMFQNAEIPTITFPVGFNTSNVTTMASMFSGCKTPTLNLGGFNTAKVAAMNGMFSNCTATTIDVSTFNTGLVTNFGAMFNGCVAPTLDLDNFVFSGLVTSVSGMFTGCTTPLLDLQSTNMSNLKSLSGMFKGCLSDVMNLRGLNLTSAFGNSSTFFETFSNCNATAVLLGGCSLPTEAESFSFSHTFQNSNIQNIELSFVNTVSCGMQYMFAGCTTGDLDLTSFVPTENCSLGAMCASCTATSVDVSTFDFTIYPDGWGNVNLDGVFDNSNIGTIYVQAGSYAMLHLHYPNLNFVIK